LMVSQFMAAYTQIYDIRRSTGKKIIPENQGFSVIHSVLSLGQYDFLLLKGKGLITVYFSFLWLDL